jgi:tetratricopeptide (TPR) repeat protein
VLVAAALIESAKGDRDAALALVEEWEKKTEDRPSDRAWPSLYVVRVLTAAGEPDQARRLLWEVSKAWGWERNIVMIRATLQEAEGASEEAASLYRQAADRWARQGSVFEQAQALHGCGRCLVALGRASDAIKPLKEAREIFESLGAMPALAETDGLLKRTTAPRSIPNGQTPSVHDPKRTRGGSHRL